MTSSHLKSANRSKTEVKKVGSSLFGALNIEHWVKKQKQKQKTKQKKPNLLIVLNLSSLGTYTQLFFQKNVFKTLYVINR